MRSGGSSGTIAVTYATSDGTAKASSDYTAATGTITFADGDSNPKTIVIGIPNDVAFEGNETFTVTLSNPTGGAGLVSPSTAVVSIIDDDTRELVVTSTADSGPGTLRQAISDANIRPGLDTITFQIGAGARTINLLSPLPQVTGGVAIDGTSQPGYAGKPLIELRGNNAGETHGIEIVAANCTISGLVVGGFARDGIHVSGAGTVNVAIRKCYIGTDLTGAVGNGNNWNGIDVGDGASRCVIDGNVVSGTRLDSGVKLHTGARENVVTGNLIGTDATGTRALGNLNSGILITSGAVNNRIGGTSPGERNVISGNVQEGIQVEDVGTTGNTIVGNFIGTDPTGTLALPNDYGGILVWYGASGTTIGATNAAGRNVISGNGQSGIFLRASGPTQVLGNYIGTSASGFAALGNQSFGIYINSSDITVGGTTTGSGNVISGNGAAGVVLYGQGTGASRNVLAGNLIGLNAAGSAAIGNAWSGVYLLEGAAGNTIGGTVIAARNVISGNIQSGIAITGTSTTGNNVVGNYIGLNGAGAEAVGNGASGIAIIGGASSNVVGGTTTAASNVISGNVDNGVIVSGKGTSGNRVQGNLIGTDVLGSRAVPNGLDGVRVEDGASGNTVGGTSTGAGNLISGNTQCGVSLIDGEGLVLPHNGTTGNRVVGNLIGLAVDRVSPLGNGNIGVHEFLSDGNQIGGTESGAGNTIAFNHGAGVSIHSPRNPVLSNSIFQNDGLGIQSRAPGSQNVPAVTASNRGGTTDLTVTFLGLANTNYRLELFKSPLIDPTGYGEGRFLVGSRDVRTGSDGLASDVSSWPLSPGDVVTATVTDPSGNTSQFSLGRWITKSTTTSLSSSSSNTEFGASVTFTAVVAPGSATGLVRFLDGTATLGESPLVSGSAQWSTSTLSIGAHSITATYLGDPGHASSTSSASTHTVTQSIAPTATIDPVSPNPRNSGVPSLTIRFSEPVSGFDLADLRLSRDGGANLLSGSQSLTAVDNRTYTLANLAALTAPQGGYDLRLTATGSGIVDAAGNALAGNASAGWVVDTTNLTATIDPVSPNPRNSGVPSLTIRFSEPVSGFDLADLRLSRDGGANLLSGSQSLIAIDNRTYTLANLAALTAPQGGYDLRLTAAGSDIVDAAGNALAGNASTGWVVDTTNLTATIDPVLPNPRNSGVPSLTIRFSEPASGFDLADLRLSRDGGANLLSGSQSLTAVDNRTYTLANLAALTTPQGGYDLRLTAAGSGIVDAAGNALAGNASTGWTVGLTTPTIALAGAANTGFKTDNTTSGYWQTGWRFITVTGKADPGVSVDLINTNPTPPFTIRTVTADASGDYTISVAGFFNGTYRLQTRAHAPSGGTASSALLPVTLVTVDGDETGASATSQAVFSRAAPALVWNILNLTSGTVAFGNSSHDVPVSGDFDADGKDDLVYYQPSTGQWFGKRSALTFNYQPAWLGTFGWPGVDVPAPADYNGDGMTDYATYRPAAGTGSDGYWSISYNYVGGATVVAPLTVALAGDMPVPGDYDGDGDAQPAVFRADTGQWFIGGASSPITFGQTGDVPVPGAYDATPTSRALQPAVFRPGTGEWLVRTPAGGAKPAYTFAVGDVPAPGDYDGDGKTDPGVFRPSTGQWLFAPAGAISPVALATYGDASSIPINAPYVYRRLPAARITNLATGDPGAGSGGLASFDLGATARGLSGSGGTLGAAAATSAPINQDSASSRRYSRPSRDQDQPRATSWARLQDVKPLKVGQWEQDRKIAWVN